MTSPAFNPIDVAPRFRHAPDPVVKTDAQALIRLGWFIILFGLGGFLIWGLWAPLDRGVPMSGKVMVTGNKKAVQHQTGGTIRKILVTEGALVKAGLDRDG